MRAPKEEADEMRQDFFNRLEELGYAEVGVVDGAVGLQERLFLPIINHYSGGEC